MIRVMSYGGGVHEEAMEACKFSGLVREQAEQERHSLWAAVESEVAG